MKTKTIAVLAALSLLPAFGFAQSPMPIPPVPPTAPVPPVPPAGPGDRDRGPKVPVTYLGVETSEVPRVVSEQLGLAKGFGLVVDYVVPDGPAAAAGVQANDILKMLNDQILTEPDQLAKLIRSFSEGTSVTLTVLRKGAETKLTAKLAKKEVPQRRGMLDFNKHWKDGKGFGGLGPEFGHEMKEMGEQLANMSFGLTEDAADNVREEARNAAREGRAAAREGMRAAREAAREARERAREFRVTRRNNGAVKTTRIDMGRAQIVYHDTQGELKLENVDGKKILIAKDPQGRLIFSGPVETKEELDKMPAEVRQRYEKLEQKDLPAIAPTITRDDQDNDADESDDAEDDDDGDDSEEAVLQVTGAPTQACPFRRFRLNIVLV